MLHSCYIQTQSFFICLIFFLFVISFMTGFLIIMVTSYLFGLPPLSSDCLIEPPMGGKWKQRHVGFSLLALKIMIECISRKWSQLFAPLYEMKIGDMLQEPFCPLNLVLKWKPAVAIQVNFYHFVHHFCFAFAHPSNYDSFGVIISLL